VPDQPAEVEAVASRFFAAIEAGDTEALRGIYAPDAVVWHNTDEIEQAVEENLVVLQWVHKHVKGWRYDDVRRTTFEGGFVQQHVGKGTAPSGLPFAMPACIVGHVDGGRVTRIEEYIDSTAVEALRARPAPPD
jgi:ketosteroid isomerase-like protein